MKSILNKLPAVIALIMCSACVSSKRPTDLATRNHERLSVYKGTLRILDGSVFIAGGGRTASLRLKNLSDQRKLSSVMQRSDRYSEICVALKFRGMAETKLDEVGRPILTAEKLLIFRETVCS